MFGIRTIQTCMHTMQCFTMLTHARKVATGNQIINLLTTK